ncbi:MAG: polyamine aminopropyltransferase [Desulfobacteraceae bacterium]|nr:polyamine aminopropyltransferase [Desulfobacteraceae bacterium]MBU4054846.1 polyamine aminopropyltransferase [Pseudomonadota bacterium]
MTETMPWVTEAWESVETRYRIKSVLYEQKTDFQHMMLVDSHAYGKMLLLDGFVQTTERDEFFYHEMMAHVPVLAHPNPENVLIIGGGDGGVLREVLKHSGVKKATVVEIDPAVVDFSKKFLPGISSGAFDDPRTRLVFDDGARFVKNTQNRYDVVIVDSSDPVGPAQILFSAGFYRDLSGIMNPEGIMTRQTGSLQMQPGEQKQAGDLLKVLFTHVAFYVFTVPTYIGGLFSTVFCSNAVDPETPGYEELNKKVTDTGLSTRYYNAGIHKGAFHIPNFFRERLS